MSRNSEVADTALLACPIFFGMLAEAAHCAPSDAVEHWYATPTEHRLDAFLDEYATPEERDE
jgi:hypothetical protein